MEIVSTLITAVNTWQMIWDEIVTFAIFGFCPIMFVLFLVLMIVQIVKRKKKGGGIWFLLL